MRVTQLLQPYAYLRPSAVRDSTAGRSLALETSGGATLAGEVANPRFFSGFLTAPAAADMDTRSTTGTNTTAGAEATPDAHATTNTARSETAR